MIKLLMASMEPIVPLLMTKVLLVEQNISMPMPRYLRLPILSCNQQIILLFPYGLNAMVFKMIGQNCYGMDKI